jgi:O-acetyl-ADP-ribose deacetylase (regulator of RNase III)
MPLQIIRNDITAMHVDAIVNAANVKLIQGGGVCGAIFETAGAKQLREECGRIGQCNVGQAVITNGYSLPAKYIIHTVGPVWQDGKHGEEANLRSCYINSLELAKTHHLKSIAFPLISSGTFGYPKDEALSVAISAIGSFLLKNDMDVYLVVYSSESYQLSRQLFESISSYIDDNFVDSHWLTSKRAKEERLWSLRQSIEMNVLMPEPAKVGLKHAVDHVGETFTEMLLRLIDERGYSDPYVYQRANIDRRLFSKIRSNPQYKPSKNTALALAVALALNLDQTHDLLARAGYALSPASRFDLIVQYFIQNGNYNIFEINEALFGFEECLLGG